MGVHLLRCLVGYLCIVVLRGILKQCCLTVFPRLLLSPENEYPYNKPLYEEPQREGEQDFYWKYFWKGYQQNYAIEIPTKLLTYATIAYAGVFTDPLCDYMGLSL